MLMRTSSEAGFGTGIFLYSQAGKDGMLEIEWIDILEKQERIKLTSSSLLNDLCPLFSGDIWC